MTTQGFIQKRGFIQMEKRGERGRKHCCAEEITINNKLYSTHPETTTVLTHTPFCIYFGGEYGTQKETDEKRTPVLCEHHSYTWFSSPKMLSACASAQSVVGVIVVVHSALVWGLFSQCLVCVLCGIPELSTLKTQNKLSNQ